MSKTDEDVNNAHILTNIVSGLTVYGSSIAFWVLYCSVSLYSENIFKNLFQKRRISTPSGSPRIAQPANSASSRRNATVSTTIKFKKVPPPLFISNHNHQLANKQAGSKNVLSSAHLKISCHVLYPWKKKFPRCTLKLILFYFLNYIWNRMFQFLLDRLSFIKCFFPSVLQRKFERRLI